MFLWVSLVLDYVGSVCTPQDLRETIAHLPSDLSKLYGRILQRIFTVHEKHNCEKAVRTLMWICHARRPLNKFELIYGLALAPGKSTLSDDEVPIARVLGLCKPLIEERHDGSVAFIHFSVQEWVHRALM